MTDETGDAYPRPRLPGDHSNALSRYRCRPWPPVPYTQDLLPPSPETSTTSTLVQNTPILYSFNLILTTATIPSSLATYLDVYHPTLTRFASPKSHRLPSAMKTEYEGWTGGNKDANVERRIRKVWADDSTRSDFNGKLSKILIFCNRGTKVQSLGSFLEGKGIPSVALTRDGSARNIHRSQALRDHSCLFSACDLIKETGVPMSCSGYGSVFGNAEHVNVNKIFFIGSWETVTESNLKMYLKSPHTHDTVRRAIRDCIKKRIPRRVFAGSSALADRIFLA